MPRDVVWEKAISESQLKAGWHLARTGLRGAFLHDILCTETFAFDLQRQIKELARQLETETFTPTHCIPIAYPKGKLGTRPGNHLPLWDRVILWSIVANIAPIVDKELDAGVYSYRLKNKPKKGELFRDSDVLDIPFLTNTFIARSLNPFQAWYTAWPQFAKASETASLRGYKFLSVTDISAYFENISHPLLKDKLFTLLPKESKLVNFVHDIFHFWAVTTEAGFKPQRGIPQGTGISSFFGNMYLEPVDLFFRAFTAHHDILYFRYMDDIRIFSKDLAVARLVLFELENRIRRLHLNVQTAKTRILRETHTKPEITWFLLDDRLARIRKITEDTRGSAPTLSKTKAVSALKGIAREKPTNPYSQRLVSRATYQEKNDLTSRALRMWMNASIYLSSDDYVATLFKEVKQSSDPRFMRIYINTVRAFPRQARWQKSILDFLRSDLNIFPYQEAQFISGVRYFSDIHPDMAARIKANVLKEGAGDDCCLKLESLISAGRMLLTSDELKTLQARFDKEERWFLLPYYVPLLAQRGGKHQIALLATLQRHPHPGVAMAGGFLNDLRMNEGRGRTFLQYVFMKNAWTRVVDWLAVLWVVAESEQKRTLLDLKSRLAKLEHPCQGIVPIVKELEKRAEQTLARL